MFQDVSVASDTNHHFMFVRTREKNQGLLILTCAPVIGDISFHISEIAPVFTRMLPELTQDTDCFGVWNASMALFIPV